MEWNSTILEEIIIGSSKDVKKDIQPVLSFNQAKEYFLDDRTLNIAILNAHNFPNSRVDVWIVPKKYNEWTLFNKKWIKLWDIEKIKWYPNLKINNIWYIWEKYLHVWCLPITPSSKTAIAVSEMAEAIIDYDWNTIIPPWIFSNIEINSEADKNFWWKIIANDPEKLWNMFLPKDINNPPKFKGLFGFDQKTILDLSQYNSLNWFWFCWKHLPVSKKNEQWKTLYSLIDKEWNHQINWVNNLGISKDWQLILLWWVPEESEWYINKWNWWNKNGVWRLLDWDLNEIAIEWGPYDSDMYDLSIPYKWYWFITEKHSWLMWIYDRTGKILMQPEKYRNITYCENWAFFATKNTKPTDIHYIVGIWWLIDTKGNELTPFMFKKWYTNNWIRQLELGEPYTSKVSYNVNNSWEYWFAKNKQNNVLFNSKWVWLSEVQTNYWKIHTMPQNLIWWEESSDFLIFNNIRSVRREWIQIYKKSDFLSKVSILEKWFVKTGQDMYFVGANMINNFIKKVSSVDSLKLLAKPVDITEDKTAILIWGKKYIRGFFKI